MLLRCIWAVPLTKSRPQKRPFGRASTPSGHSFYSLSLLYSIVRAHQQGSTPHGPIVMFQMAPRSTCCLDSKVRLSVLLRDFATLFWLATSCRPQVSKAWIRISWEGTLQEGSSTFASYCFVQRGDCMRLRRAIFSYARHRLRRVPGCTECVAITLPNGHSPASD